MKIYDYKDLVKGESYFVVYRGVVYYGVASNADWDEDIEPTTFYVEDDLNATADNPYGETKVCCTWEATLIYTL